MKYNHIGSLSILNQFRFADNDSFREDAGFRKSSIFTRLLLCIAFSVLSSNVWAVDLYLTNATATEHLATARATARPDELVRIPPRARNKFIENITPSDTLSIYAVGQTKPWGKFLITLGGQRNEPIWLTIAELQCGQFILQDPLNEPGEGGYSIQILHVDTLPAKSCPAQLG